MLTRVDLAARPRDYGLATDLGLMALGSVGFALVLTLAVRGAALSPELGVSAPVASVSTEMGEVQRRGGAVLLWSRLGAGDAVYRSDSVFVANNSEATLVFGDGTSLQLGENTLVVIDQGRAPEGGGAGGDATAAAAALQIELKRGNVTGLTAGSGPVRLVAGNSVAAPRRGATARASMQKDAGATIQAMQGETALSAGGEEVVLSDRAARRVGAEGALEAPEASGIRLAEPEDGNHLYFAETAIEASFRWEPTAAHGAYTFELADDAAFARPLVSSVTTATQARVMLDRQGVFYWRVTQSQGPGRPALASDIYRLVVVQDVAPVPLRPRMGEVVYSPSSSTVDFAWSGLRSAQKYRVLVARDRELSQVVADLVVEGTGVSYTFPLDGDVYYWNVRVHDAARAITAVSKTVAFRLTTKPLLRPPRLFDPTLEFEAPPSPPPEPTKSGLWLWELLVPSAHAASPAGPAVAIQVLRWERVPEAVGYEVQVSEDTTFASIVEQHRTTDTYLRWQPPSKLKSYYFRVASVSDDGRVGKFSDAKLIQQVLAVPQPTGPDDGAAFAYGVTRPTVLLTWKGSQSVARYLVQIDADRGFGTARPPTPVEGAERLSWQPEAVGVYYWRVAAVDTAGTATSYSEPRRLVVPIAVPELKRPESRTVLAFSPANARVQLSWSAGPARRYEVQVGRDGRFTSKATQLTAIEPTVTFVAPEAGAYAWRVRAIADSEALGPTAWSAVASFELRPAALVLVEPNEGAVVSLFVGDTSVPLRWQPAKGAKRYDVELARVDGEGAGASGESAPQKLSVTATELVATIDAPGDFEWRVTGVDGAGRLVDFSASRRFRVTRVLRSPAPASPIGGSKLVLLAPAAPPLTLSWSAVTAATAYEVETAATPDFAGAAAARATTTEVQIEAARLGVYHWRVRALGEDGLASDWSQAKSFAVASKAARAEATATPHDLEAAAIAVRVYDNAGGAVDGLTLTARASSGTLGPLVGQGDGRYTAEWTIDADSDESAPTVTIAGPFGLGTSVRVPLGPPATLMIGAAFGAANNLGAEVAGRGQIDLSLRPPILSRHLMLIVTAGYHLAGDPEAGGSNVTTTLHRVPLTAALAARWRLGLASLYGGPALALQFFTGTLQVQGAMEQSEQGVQTGGGAVVGGEYEVGPGAIILEGAYTWMPAHNGLFALGGSSLSLVAGYRFALF